MIIIIIVRSCLKVSHVWRINTSSPWPVATQTSHTFRLTPVQPSDNPRCAASCTVVSFCHEFRFPLLPDTLCRVSCVTNPETCERSNWPTCYDSICVWPMTCPQARLQQTSLTYRWSTISHTMMNDLAIHIFLVKFWLSMVLISSCDVVTNSLLWTFQTNIRGAFTF